MATPMVYGHRGASGHAPENTVEAFVLAGRLGADGVELDVRRCASGQLVVHHDPALADGRSIAETAATDLPEWLPTLAEALDACAGLVVNIEIKNLPREPHYDPACRLADEVVEVLRERGGDDEVLVSSFDLATIDRVRALSPATPTGYLTLVEPAPLDAVAVASAGGHGAVHPYHAFVDAELVTAAHAAGLAVNVWTADEPERISALAELGVDGIVTNLVDVAIAALAGQAGTTRRNASGR